MVRASAAAIVRDDIREGTSSQPDDEDEFDDEEDAETYEETRRRRILENQLLLDQLGIQATPNSSTRPAQTSTSKRRKRDAPHKTVYDRSGFIISQPGPSEIHRMACVEMPSDRKLLRHIAEGEYQDCTHWREGEERRWRFGHGRGGNLAVGDEELLGDVGEDFRWRKWGGLNRELRREMRKRGELNEMDARPATPVRQTTEGVSAYSLIPGETCHQCRRKSEKRKMKCRNVDPVCRGVFCETCCKRYSYFEFDPESRSFICPLCKDCCNCSNCIRKRNLAHLLGPTGKGIRTKSLSIRIRKENKEAITVQAWLEKAVEDRVGVPFDRVRLVDQATDVFSPELPPDETQVPQTAPKGKKKRKLAGSHEGGTKAKKKRIEPPDLVVKLNLPPDSSMPQQQKPSKVKEVDSDGDTVGGWSTDDDVAAKPSSSLSSRTPSPSERRLAFPPRPSVVTPNINDYLSRLANPAHDTAVDPTLIYPTFESFSTMQLQSFSVNGRLASLQPDTSPTLSTEDPAGPELGDENDILLDLQPSEASESRALQPLLVPDPPRATITDVGSVAWPSVAGPAQASFLTQHQSSFSTETFDSLALPPDGFDDHPSYGYDTYPYSQTSSLESLALGGPSQISPLPLHNQPPPYSRSPPAQTQSLSGSTHDPQQSTSKAVTHDRPGDSHPHHPIGRADASAAYRQQSASAQNLDLLSLAAAEARQSPNVEDRGYPTSHIKSSVVTRIS